MQVLTEAMFCGNRMQQLDTKRAPRSDLYPDLGCTVRADDGLSPESNALCTRTVGVHKRI